MIDFLARRNPDRNAPFVCGAWRRPFRARRGVRGWPRGHDADGGVFQPSSGRGPAAVSLVGIGLALAGGAAIGLVVAIVTVRYRADNMVTGLTANIVAAGLTSYLLRVLSGAGRPVAIHLTPLPPWADPWPGRPARNRAVAVRPPAADLSSDCRLHRPRNLPAPHASGPDFARDRRKSETVFASGVDPMRVRIVAVVALRRRRGPRRRSAIASAGRNLYRWHDRSRGYLALASLIVARWNPLGAALACLAFGAAEAFELRLQGFGVPVSSYVVQMAPYLIALGRARGTWPHVENAGVHRTTAVVGPMRIETFEGRIALGR